MKRQIFTALSLTLLISSPLTLNAGKDKPGSTSKKKKNKGGSSNTLNKLATPENLESAHCNDNSDGERSASISPVTQASSSSSTADLPSLALTTEAQASNATATLPADFSFEYAILPAANSSSSTQPDEFDPSDTKAQRAALFAAIVALESKTNGRKRVDCFHELRRQTKNAELYNSETHAIIKTQSIPTQAIVIAPAATQTAELTDREQRFAGKYVIAQWRLGIAKKHLTKTQEELAALKAQKAIDLFPSSPTLQSSSHITTPEYFAGLPDNADDFERLSQDGKDKDTTTPLISPPAPTITPAPAAGSWSIWGLLGYKTPAK
jgi:hypothetical protein